jgi:hypothetical protein
VNSRPVQAITSNADWTASKNTGCFSCFEGSIARSTLLTADNAILTTPKDARRTRTSFAHNTRLRVHFFSFVSQCCMHIAHDAIQASGHYPVPCWDGPDSTASRELNRATCVDPVNAMRHLSEPDHL